MRLPLLAACLVVATGAFVGCGAGRVPIHEGTRSFTASDYGGVYDRWTRAGDEFDFGRLAEILHVTATFES